MAQHNIGIVAVVFNDSAYGNVKRIQEVDLGGKLIASDLLNPDYVKLADAFGIEGRRVDTPEAFEHTLNDLLKAGHPALIEVPVGPMPNPWKLLGLR
jgi:acetolactate synthase-1/2/3 large subunit